MDKRYIYGSEENRQYMNSLCEELLNFGHRFPSEGGSSFYLGDDGTPWTDRPRETWITCRMVHVYSIGKMLHHEGSEALAAAGIKGLLGELCDKENGGWYAGIRADGTPLENKQCYAHAFVILAATSGVLAEIPGAAELLDKALKVYDEYFWDDNEGLAVDTWNTDFSVLCDYRGLNANMHTVEAFLAVADALGKEEYRDRAGRIINRVCKWAGDNDYRIPEHFSKDWTPDLECNSDKKADQFKPYGATPGHGIEWARLIIQWAKSTFTDAEERITPYFCIAKKLYNRAIEDAWNCDGAEGIVYTTDWEGKPVVHDRMHWTLAEAINTSATIFSMTGTEKYKEEYGMFLEYLENKVHDKVNGSWFHQLDENNELMNTVWPGKSDIYHALQSTLIPYGNVGVSIATDICKNR